MNNNKLLKEFQKYNSDLEKHLPKMDIDFVKEINNLDQSNPSEEMLALLINTVNDLKIEVALTRKNMADNIEGMVMRVINNEHNQLVKHVNDLNAKMVANVRDSFNAYITQLNTELSTIRKNFNKVTIATQNMTEAFKSTNSEISDINMTINDFKNIRQELNLGIEKINDRLDNTVDNVIKLKSQIPKLDIKKELNQIKNNVIENSHEIKHIETLNKHNITTPTHNQQKPTIEIPRIPNSQEHINKILTIDERLKKLDALK